MINADNHGVQDSVHWWYLFIIKLRRCLFVFSDFSINGDGVDVGVAVDDDINKEKLQATEQVAWAFLQTSGSLAQVRMRIFIF